MYLQQCFGALADVERSYAVERVYSHATFTQPTAFLTGPSGAFIYIAERAGRVWMLPENEETILPPVLAIDISNVVDAGAPEAGLLGMAFSPRFANEPHVYLSYTVTGDPLRSRVVRYDVAEDGTFDADTAWEILEQPQPAVNNNGGYLAFGPDGMLYISLGDGGGVGDAYEHGQNPDTWLGALLRIDVSRNAVDEHNDGQRRRLFRRGPPPVRYVIPEGNAFPEGEGGRPEIYAWGLRNVRHFSFDRANGQLWAGEVGQNAFEEVNLIVPGGNFGWPVKEGASCFAEDPCDSRNFIDPVYAYDHLAGDRSITGGYIYRGNALQELEGRYIFGDLSSGRIFALSRSAPSGFVSTLLLDSPLEISGFGETQRGELRLLDFRNGGIWRLAQDGVANETEDGVPATLSETGCFEGPGLREATPGLVGYSVAHELWSDGTSKSRFFGLPPGTRFEVDDAGRWSLPPGGVAIKHFDRDGVRLETRVVTREASGAYRFFTYAWNEAGTDATLVPRIGREDAARDWSYPSEQACTGCHTSSAGRTLGFETRQLNINHRFAQTGLMGHQIATYEAVGFVGPVARLPAFAGRDDDAEVDAKARAYLHVNCASCHRAGGPTPVALDLRFDQSLGAMFACDYPAVARADIPLQSPRIMVPGEPDASMLHARMQRRDRWGMPSIGSARIDEVGAVLVADWIRSLGPCP